MGIFRWLAQKAEDALDNCRVQKQQKCQTDEAEKAIDPAVDDVQKLTQDMKGEDAEVRMAALLEALRDEDYDVRWDATRALGRMGDAAVPALIEALGDEEIEVGRCASWALGKIGDAAVPALTEALGDEDDARVNAALALGMIGDAVVVPALIEAFRDEIPGVRGLAAEFLSKIGDAAVPALIEALGDEDHGVRLHAADVLKNMINRCKATEALDSLEGTIGDGFDSLKERCQEKDKLIRATMNLAKLMIKISEKKNRLASDRGLLLTDMPKPPKRRGMFQAVRVRNGNL